MYRTLRRAFICGHEAGAALLSLPAALMHASKTLGQPSAGDIRGYLIDQERLETSGRRRMMTECGLTFRGMNPDDSLDFYCLTKEGEDLSSLPHPAFTPHISILRIADNKMRLMDEPSSHTPQTSTSIPTVPSAQTPLDSASEKTVVDAQGNFWICHPKDTFFTKLDKQGRILFSFTPDIAVQEGLANTKCRGITIDEEGQLVVLLKQHRKKGARNSAYFLLCFVPETHMATLSAFPAREAESCERRVRFSGITSIGSHEFLVLEQTRQSGLWQSRICKLSLGGSKEDTCKKGLFIRKEPILPLTGQLPGGSKVKVGAMVLLPDRQTLVLALKLSKAAAKAAQNFIYYCKLTHTL
jgi:hypothetical protein